MGLGADSLKSELSNENLGQLTTLERLILAVPQIHCSSNCSLSLALGEKQALALDCFIPVGLQTQGSQNCISRQAKPRLWELQLPSTQAFPTHRGRQLGGTDGYLRVTSDLL